MFIVVNGQMVALKHNRIVQIQRLTDEDRYRASLKFGISDVVAQAMIKGLCYTKMKEVCDVR